MKKTRYKKIKEILGGFRFFLAEPNHGFDIIQTAKKLDDFFEKEIQSKLTQREAEVREEERERIFKLADGITYADRNGAMVDVRKDIEDYEKFLQYLNQHK